MKVRALLLSALWAGFAPAFAAEPLAIIGNSVHTMAGATLKDAAVLVKDGKIEAIGSTNSVAIPADYRILRARVVTPGLIDARSTAGMSGILNQPHDQEQIEKSAPIQPELRALDSYNGRDPLVEWVRSFGVTTLQTGHAPGALVSGQTIIVKTWPEAVDEALVRAPGMITAALGAEAIMSPEKSPGNRAKAVAMLRAELIKAGEYARKQEKAEEEKKAARDLRLEALAGVLSGKTPLLVTAHRAPDILAALRIAAEFKIRIVLDGASEAYLVLDEIRKSGFPVILHPTMFRAQQDSENLSMETAAKLRQAGIPFALQSGFEDYVPKTRVVLFEAALAAANGLSKEDALASITTDAARLLGISNRTGSLEAGKDADLALFDGDPFEYTTHCIGVVISGQVVRDEAH